MIPTKKGFGIEIWGTENDLESFYDVISQFWNDEHFSHIRGYENRNKLISGFSYEMRKAMEGSRQKRKTSHFSLTQNEYLGTKVSWVHFLFSLAAIRQNMRFVPANKYEIAMILQIEYLLERAMREFDEVGAKQLIPFLENAIFSSNEYLYQYMRSINVDYFLLGGGKGAFRKLSILMMRSVYYSAEYSDYLRLLEKDAKNLKCEINELEINDDDIDYHALIW